MDCHSGFHICATLSEWCGRYGSSWSRRPAPPRPGVLLQKAARLRHVTASRSLASKQRGAARRFAQCPRRLARHACLMVNHRAPLYPCPKYPAWLNQAPAITDCTTPRHATPRHAVCPCCLPPPAIPRLDSTDSGTDLGSAGNRNGKPN